MNKKSHYSPKISYECIFILKRLSWSYNKPMTKVLNEIIKQHAYENKEQVCSSCIDKRCHSCKIEKIESFVDKTQEVEILF